MRGIIAALSPEGAIGLHGRIPWHHSADLKHFKRTTMGATIIMGRKTWESIGGKALPGRRNIVISSGEVSGAESFRSIEDALATCEGDVWFVGGAGIYAAAMPLCDVMHITNVPDHIEDPDAVHFPEIDPAQWEADPAEPLADDPALTVTVYRRK